MNDYYTEKQIAAIKLACLWWWLTWRIAVVLGLMALGKAVL